MLLVRGYVLRLEVHECVAQMNDQSGILYRRGTAVEAILTTALKQPLPLL